MEERAVARRRTLPPTPITEGGLCGTEILTDGDPPVEDYYVQSGYSQSHPGESANDALFGTYKKMIHQPIGAN